MSYGNIVWQRPDGSIAITTLAVAMDPAAHAAELQERGDIPTDYVAVAFNAEVPADRSARDSWRWDGEAIVAPPVDTGV